MNIYSSFFITNYLKYNKIILISEKYVKNIKKIGKYEKISNNMLLKLINL